MDPVAALIEFLTALAEGDIEAADQNSRAITEWIANGGFVPQGIDDAINAIRKAN